MQTEPNNQGFTLTDMMVTVALVGILAALAIPSYQSYRTRSLVSEGIAAINPLKDEMAYYYTVKGAFPADNQALGIVPSHYATDIIKSISINAAGDLVTTFKAIGSQIKDGESIEFQPDLTHSGAIEWICTPSSTDGVQLRYVPASCRSDS